MMNRVMSLIQENIRLLIGYVFFAGIATLVDIGLLYLFTEYLELWYLYSAALSYLTGMVINYTLNKNYNFRNRSNRIASQFGIFAGVALIGLALNQIILYLFVSILGIWYIFAKVITVCIVLMWSFYGHKRFTFGILR
jgi:putative flippase GtrA